jgi:hypothetical protein
LVATLNESARNGRANEARNTGNEIVFHQTVRLFFEDARMAWLPGVKRKDGRKPITGILVELGRFLRHELREEPAAKPSARAGLRPCCLIL